MTKTVFYSWQADHPTSVCRNFIRSALERAIADQGASETVSEAQRPNYQIDSDTQGVPGTPPIAETIFRKIAKASLFVADMSFVATRANGRPAPNPNVLIEYGYALSRLGSERIILLVNEHFGVVTDDNLPFNLRHLRHPIKYTLAPDADEDTRREERAKLLKKITKIFSSAPATVGEEEIQIMEDEEPRHRGSLAPKSRPIGIISSSITGHGTKIYFDPSLSIWIRVKPIDKKVSNNKDKCIEVLQNPTISMPLYGGYRGLDYFKSSQGGGLVPGCAKETGSAPTFIHLSQYGEILSADSVGINTFKNSGLAFIDVPMLAKALQSYRETIFNNTKAKRFWVRIGVNGLEGRDISVKATDGGSLSLGTRRGTALVDEVTWEGEVAYAVNAYEALSGFVEKLNDSIT